VNITILLLCPLESSLDSHHVRNSDENCKKNTLLKMRSTASSLSVVVAILICAQRVAHAQYTVRLPIFVPPTAAFGAYTRPFFILREPLGASIDVRDVYLFRLGTKPAEPITLPGRRLCPGRLHWNWWYVFSFISLSITTAS
jgi:hypothetical protein